MPSRTLSDQSDIPMFASLLGTLKLPVTVSWIVGRDRTAEQNRLMWLWAQEAADQRGDMTRTEVQQEWKLRHGVPILRAEDPEFRQTYDAAVKALPYDRKLALMAYMPITSEFKVPQMVAFLDAVDRECAQQGIRLTQPDPDLAKYQARYRAKEAA
jgi:hypothetical protein